MSDKPELDGAAYAIKLPKDVYKLRCTDAKKQNAKTGSPMHVLSLEIVEQEEKINDIDINGLPFTHFGVITEKSIEHFNRMRNALGLEEVTIDEVSELNTSDYLGAKGYAVCQGEEVAQTSEDGEKVLKDPYTGKPLTSMQRKIIRWIPHPTEE